MFRRVDRDFGVSSAVGEAKLEAEGGVKMWSNGDERFTFTGGL